MTTQQEDILKGLLIEARQTLQEFIAEEIVRKKGIKMSSIDFQKTSIFKSGVFIPSDWDTMYTPQMTLKLSYDNFLTTKTNSKDEAGPANSTVSAQMSTPDSVPQLTSIAPAISITLPEIFTEPTTSQAVTMKLRYAKMTIPTFTNKFWSGVTVEINKLPHAGKHNLRFMLQYGMISAPDPYSYRANFLDTLLQWIDSKTYQLFGEFPSEIEPTYQLASVTPTPNIGFDLRSLIMKLESFPDDIRQYLSLLKQIADDTPTDKLEARSFKLKSAIITDNEARFQTAVDALNRRRFIAPRAVHDFMSLFSDMFLAPNPIPSFDLDFTTSYLPGEMKALHAFLSSKRNFRLYPMMWDFWTNIVKDNIALNVRGDDRTYVELLKVLAASTTTHRVTNDYPARIKSPSARTFLEQFFTVKLAGRFAKLRADIAFEDASMSQLLQCIVIKLFLAKEDVHPDTVMDVDNYLAKWWVPALPGFKRVVNIDEYAIRNRTANYLDLQFQSGALSNKGAEWWAFAHTTQAGSGWATAGKETIFQLPNEAIMFLNRRKFHYKSPFGSPLADRLATTDQWVRFEAWVNSIQNGAAKVIVSIAHERVGASIIKLCMWLLTRRSHFSEFVWYADRVIRMFTLNALFEPEIVPLPVNMVEGIMILPDSIFSALAFMDFTAQAPITGQIQLVDLSWAIHDDFNRLNDITVLASQHLIGDTYSRKDFLKYALDHTPDSTGFISMLRMQLIDLDEFKSIDMPGSKYVTKDFADRVKLSQEFIHDHLVAFGVLSEFVYAPDAQLQSDNHFQRYYVFNQPVRSVNYLNLQDHISSETFTSTLATARRNKENILFKMPINYEVEERSVWRQTANPIIMPSSTTILRFNKLKIPFSTFDIIINDNDSDLLDERESIWLADVRSRFIAYDIGFAASLIRKIRVPRRDMNYYLIADVTFFSRITV